MPRKVLLTILENDVAPRFDHTSEVLVAVLDDKGNVVSQKTVVLPQASAEELCHLILSEEVTDLICGGVEEEYYQYLNWKKVRVFDSVMGPYEAALEMFRQGRLDPETILGRPSPNRLRG